MSSCKLEYLTTLVYTCQRVPFISTEDVWSVKMSLKSWICEKSVTFFMLNNKKGFRWRRAKVAPELTDEQKRERVEWCVKNLHENFNFYTFVDECSMYIRKYPYYHWRFPRQNRRRPIGRSTKYRYKINIWGGISKEGPCEFSVLFIFSFFLAFTILRIFNMIYSKDIH
jgi:hypothetical protein